MRKVDRVKDREGGRKMAGGEEEEGRREGERDLTSSYSGKLRLV